ncbi:MAG TPA: hypothetical protein VF508_01585 [Pyrinomonadaceae bacterium]|jgi:hypothetical protein
MDTPTIFFVLCLLLAAFLLTTTIRRDYLAKERLRRDIRHDLQHAPLRTRPDAPAPTHAPPALARDPSHTLRHIPRDEPHEV